MDYTLSATNITDISFDIIITANVATTGTRILALKVEDASAPGTGTSFMLTDTGMAQGGTKTFSVGGSGGAGMVIDANTEYDISLKVNDAAVADPITVTTKSTGYDTPRTATQEQWENLADRVNIRPIIGTVVSQPTAVAYVDTANIVNDAVTPAKLDMASLIDILYPVGCYFETSDTTFDPNVSWGGTWAEDSAGKVTVSQDTNDTDFDTVGNTGGSKELQEHIHSAGKYDGYTINNNGVTSGSGTTAITVNTSSTTSSSRIQTNSAGTGNSGNLQPYVVVKRWHRTA